MYVYMCTYGENKHEEDIERHRSFVHRESYRQEAAVAFLEFQKSTKQKANVESREQK